jgi:hypothetical protein
VFLTVDLHGMLFKLKMRRKIMSDISDDEFIETPIQTVDILNAHDWFLQSTIENIVSLGVDIGVTLSVNGVIVSGMLINGKKYFELLGDAMIDAAKQPEDLTNVLGKAWKGHMALYEKPEGAPEGWKIPSAGYAHLMNAKFLSPGQIAMPDGAGMFWRCKLSSVDGFSPISLGT